MPAVDELAPDEAAALDAIVAFVSDALADPEVVEALILADVRRVARAAP
jgi:hypothetical protein